MIKVKNDKVIAEISSLGPHNGSYISTVQTRKEKSFERNEKSEVNWCGYIISEDVGDVYIVGIMWVRFAGEQQRTALSLLIITPHRSRHGGPTNVRHFILWCVGRVKSSEAVSFIHGWSPCHCQQWTSPGSDATPNTPWNTNDSRPFTAIAACFTVHFPWLSDRFAHTGPVRLGAHQYWSWYKARFSGCTAAWQSRDKRKWSVPPCGLIEMTNEQLWNSPL